VSDDPAAVRAHDLATLSLGLLESCGPGARGLCVFRGLARVVLRIEMATDDDLEAVAVARGLRERALVVERRPAVWYYRASARWPSAWITATGPRHPGAPPDAIG